MYLELSDLGLHSGNVVNVRFKLGERLTDNADANSKRSRSIGA
jgi:hypothetical protein